MKLNLNGKKIELTILRKDEDEFEYYIGNQLVGGLKTTATSENIVFRSNVLIAALIKMGVIKKDQKYLQNTLESELRSQIRDQINAIDREKLSKESKQTDNMFKYIKSLKIDKIKDVKILDLEREENQEELEEEQQKLEEDEIGEQEKEKTEKDEYEEEMDSQEKEELEEKTDEKNKKSKENRKEKDIEKNEEKDQEKDEEENEEDKKKIEKTNVKDVNIKQEVELDERANDMSDIRKWLGGQIPKDIVKIGVIESYQMNKIKDDNGKSYENETTRYSLVAIGKDGTVEALQKYIPQLQTRTASGNNPTQEKYQIRDDGTVEKDAILSEYEIGDKIIQLDNKEMGRVEMNIGQEARDTTETLGMQVRDSNTIYATDTSTRSVMGEYERRNGEDTVKKNLEEIKMIDKKDPDCEIRTEKDIDGDKGTKSHIHIQEAYAEVIAREVMKRYPELGETYNQADIEKKVIEKMKDKEYLSKEQLISDVEKLGEEMSKQAQMEHEQPGHSQKIG